MRAAMLEEFGQPLAVTEVELTEPRAGEVLVRLAACGVCHTDLYTLFSPQCRECVHCLDPRTNLCLAIRGEQNLGHLPDGSTRLRRDGEEIRHVAPFLSHPITLESPTEKSQSKSSA